MLIKSHNLTLSALKVYNKSLTVATLQLCKSNSTTSPMLTQPTIIFYLNLQVGFITDDLFSYPFLIKGQKYNIVFQVKELHNRRHGDRWLFHTQIPQHYWLKRESKERKKQPRAYCNFWDHSSPSSSQWRDSVRIKEVKWLITRFRVFPNVETLSEKVMSIIQVRVLITSQPNLDIWCCFFFFFPAL